MMGVKLTYFIFYYFIISTLFRALFTLLFSAKHPVYKSEKRIRLMVNAGIILDCGVLILSAFSLPYLVPITLHNFMYTALDFKLYWSGYSFAFLCFSIVVISIIARLSIYYLHRDSYYYKFFSLLFILELAICLLIMTNGCESIFIGWELLGLSSVLLIAFYEHRPNVLKNSLIILVIYKIADVIFYSTLIYAAYLGIHNYNEIISPWMQMCLLLVCLIKSSIFPWVWLPRAMEGPTPSSSVFYGGLATHIPIFIFLNIWSYSLHHNIYLITIAIIFILSATIIVNAMSRQATDAKNAIAYASVTQLGIIYIEILLGFYTLAVIHCIANGVYRSFEFLKSPSLIYYRHNIDKCRKSIDQTSGFHLERFLPASLQRKLYNLSYHEFYLPRLLIHFIESFLGLNASRINLKSLKAYIIPSLIAFILVEIIVAHVTHTSITVLDESLLLLSFLFNVIAIINKYHPFKFFIAISTSMMTIFSILVEQIYQKVIVFDYIFLAILIWMIADLIRRMFLRNIDLVYNFTGHKSKSPSFNLFILLLGLSIVGVPGLAAFFVWQPLEHLLLSISPNLLIDCFVLLSLNTLIFFRFYYANYLGKLNSDVQYKAVYRE